MQAARVPRNVLGHGHVGVRSLESKLRLVTYNITCSRGYALVDLPTHLRIDRAAVSVVKPPFLMRFLRFRFLVEVLWLLPASLCFNLPFGFSLKRFLNV